MRAFCSVENEGSSQSVGSWGWCVDVRVAVRISKNPRKMQRTSYCSMGGRQQAVRADGEGRGERPESGLPGECIQTFAFACEDGKVFSHFLSPPRPHLSPSLAIFGKKNTANVAAHQVRILLLSSLFCFRYWSGLCRGTQLRTL